MLIAAIDHFVPAELLSSRSESVRARVTVGGSFFATIVSIVVQGIRLLRESQHWVALVSWAVCTSMFMAVPVILRRTGRLKWSGALVSLAMLIGSLGVALREGGFESPNAVVMFIAPLVATQLGGWRAGVIVELLVLALAALLWFAQAHGFVASSSPLDRQTLLTMRPLLLIAVCATGLLITLLYELERDRAEHELEQAAMELARARQTEAREAATRIELFEAERLVTEAHIELLASQRRELERDLSLTAAVQKLLLPKSDRLDTDFVSVAGFSVTAAQAGGDWWFTEPLPDGGVRVMLGDVTGHGAAPAMVTAVVAGAFRATQESGHASASDLLCLLNAVSRSVSSGLYTMPFGLLEVSPCGEARWFSAAAPPLLVLRRNGEVDTYTLPGTPLGSATFSVGECRFQVGPADRLLLTSDGVHELRLASGYDLGLRRLAKLLKSTRQADVGDARDQLVERLEVMRGHEALRDDVTLAVVDMRAVRTHRLGLKIS